MHPELDHAKLKELQQPQQRSLWKSFTGALAKFISHISSSDKSEPKRLPVVKTYLAQYHEFITGKSKLNLSSVEVVKEIMFTVISLLNNSFYTNGSSFSLLYSNIKLVRDIVLSCMIVCELIKPCTYYPCMYIRMIGASLSEPHWQ